MLYVLNHKANMTSSEVLNYLDGLNDFDLGNVIFAPSTCYLPYYRGLKLASQDVSCYTSGAHTGEVTASQLVSLGVSYTIIGHSERRQEFLENDEVLTSKIKRVLEEDILPIYCVGEISEDEDVSFIVKELDLLNSFSKEQIGAFLIAYEPIWAIGTGKVPTAEKITSVIGTIKDTCQTRFGVVPKVLYGGSVNSSNIVNLKKIVNVDGFLIGGASLKIEELKNIL